MHLKVLFVTLCIFSSLQASILTKQSWVPIIVSDIITFAPYHLHLPDKDGDGIEDSLDTPIAHTQNITVSADNGYDVTLSGEDNDNPLSYSVVTQPTHGTLNGTAPLLHYIPHDGYSGKDSFTFMVNDGDHDSNVITVYIHVEAISTHIPFDKSLLECAFKIPIFNITDPDVTTIKNISDLRKLNDKKYNIFLISSGFYNTGYTGFQITMSGTADKQKYILLDHTDNTHTGRLTQNNQANLRFFFNNVRYWNIDRISSINISGEYQFIHHVLNSLDINFSRLHALNTKSGLKIDGNSSRITIAHSRFEKSNITYASDGGAIELFNYLATSSIQKNIHILDNEIVNYGDGVQVVDNPNYAGLRVHDVSGLKILRNHVYVDKRFRSDGNGNQNDTGDFVFAENAFDFKSGAIDPKNPIEVKDNYMWGFRKAVPIVSTVNNHTLNAIKVKDYQSYAKTYDTLPFTTAKGDWAYLSKKDGNHEAGAYIYDGVEYTYKGIRTGMGDSGTAMVAHYGTQNLHILNNFVFDSNYVFSSGNKQKADFGTKGLLIKGNIFHDIRVYGLTIEEQEDTKISNNLFKNMGNNYPEGFISYTTALNFFGSEHKNIHITNNIFENIKNQKGEVSYVLSGNTKASSIFQDNFTDTNNKYFNAKEDTDFIFGIKSEFTQTDNYLDHIFVTDRYTNSPRDILIPKVIKP